MTSTEARLRQVLAEVDRFHPASDLFGRVWRSIEEDRAHRKRVRKAVAAGVGAAVGVAAVLTAATDIVDRRVVMAWWVLEAVVVLVLVAIALTLGPFIKRFGRSYAADVFRSNPRTGKSFIVLTDFAYYLIFFAYILLSLRIEPTTIRGTVTPDQVKEATARIGGILLIMGILHSANLLVLPIIGRLLTLNRRLDADTPPTE